MEMSLFQITETRNGLKTLTIRNQANGKDIRIHSSYDPDREAERSIESFSKGRASILLVSGIGLGYHIKFLKKKYPDISIIAIEKEKEIKDICYKIYPDSLEGIEVITSPEDIVNVFDHLPLSGFKGISHYIHKPSYQINTGFYEEMVSQIRLQISSRISDLLTRFEFEEKWIANIFKNIKHVEESTDVSKLFSRFRGYPGIIVSAGPSLKKNIRNFAAVKEHAVIIAVDTAYKVLDKYGISPHFVLTLDAQKQSLKHFSGISNRETVLVADIVSCPDILRNFKGEKIISTTSKYYQDENGNTLRETTPMLDWIEKSTGVLGDIQSGGSVATSAFDLLLNMGCDPIILTGQDLAYTGREYHCSGTYHLDDWLPGTSRLNNIDTINQNVIRKRKIKYVESYGNNGMVISDFVFDLYRTWFEDSTKLVTVKVINSTEGGSYIKNTSELDLLNAVKDFTGKPAPSEIIREILADKKVISTARLKKALNTGYKNLKLIEKLTDDGETDDKVIMSINTILEDDDTNSLIQPLMRKTGFYLSRHALDSEKSKNIMLNEIKNSSKKMITILEASNLVNPDIIKY